MIQRFLPLVTILILTIALVHVWLNQPESGYSENSMMKMYSIGYNDGYYNAQQRAHEATIINDSMIVVDYSSHDSIFSSDSAKIYNSLFK